jgi:uncharacterized protein
MRLRLLCLLLPTLGLLAACSRAEPPAAPPVKTIADTFPLRIGDQVIQAQIAMTSLEQQQGLMQRRDLASDGGMLFVYPAPIRMSFWMRNTPTPLDLACFDAQGLLGEVLALHPFDETPRLTQRDTYTLALETHQGWFAEHGLKPGEARLNLADVAAALTARGFAPRRYGVETPAAP